MQEEAPTEVAEPSPLDAEEKLLSAGAARPSVAEKLGENQSFDAAEVIWRIAAGMDRPAASPSKTTHLQEAPSKASKNIRERLRQKVVQKQALRDESSVSDDRSTACSHFAELSGDAQELLCKMAEEAFFKEFGDQESPPSSPPAKKNKKGKSRASVQKALKRPSHSTVARTDIASCLRDEQEACAEKKHTQEAEATECMDGQIANGGMVLQHREDEESKTEEEMERNSEDTLPDDYQEEQSTESEISESKEPLFTFTEESLPAMQSDHSEVPENKVESPSSRRMSWADMVDESELPLDKAAASSPEKALPPQSDAEKEASSSKAEEPEVENNVQAKEPEVETETMKPLEPGLLVRQNFSQSHGARAGHEILMALGVGSSEASPEGSDAKSCREAKPIMVGLPGGVRDAPKVVEPSLRASEEGPVAARRVCKECDSTLSCNARFCTSCGAKQPGQVACTACSSIISADARFCTSCGCQQPGCPAPMDASQVLPPMPMAQSCAMMMPPAMPSVAVAGPTESQMVPLQAAPGTMEMPVQFIAMPISFVGPFACDSMVGQPQAFAPVPLVCGQPTADAGS